MGLIFSILLFFFGNTVVPISMGRANQIWQSEVKKRSAISSREKDIWIKAHRSIAHITYFMPADKAIFGVTLNYFDDGFRLTKRIDAEKGVYTGGTWHLFNVVEQNLLEDDGNYEVSSWEERAAELEFVPEDLRKVAKKPEEMTYDELSTYVREVEQEGYDATTYRVDLSAKIAFPVVCIVMSIVGTGLTFWRKKKEALAGSIFFGIVMAFLYWTVHSFCLSLGYGAMLSPMVAAWFTNGIFMCFGIFALLNAD
jgi:lipopolysaccharide export system permease protein